MHTKKTTDIQITEVWIIQSKGWSKVTCYCNHRESIAVYSVKYEDGWFQLRCCIGQG